FGDFHYDIISFFFSSRRRHTRSKRDWSSDVCSSDLFLKQVAPFFHDAPYLHYEHELTYLQLDQSLPLLITSFPIRDLPTSFSYTDRKSTRLNSSHVSISYAVFCLKKKKNNTIID